MPNTALSRRALLALCAATTNITTGTAADAADKPKILASFSILADLAQVIGGDAITVTTLVGPGQDTHAFQPRPSDARTLASARVLLVNGLGFEGWMDRLGRAAQFKGVQITATTGIQPRRSGPGATTPDPHAWQDVANTKLYVRNIRDGLIQADPANAAATQNATAAYLTQLEQLDAEIRAAWATIPRAARRIVTSHDAFTYYGAAYGVDFFAPQGLAADSEPTPRQLATLIAQIRAQKIRAAFVESIGNPRMLQQLARETGARIGPVVFSDTLSPQTGPASSYLAMMRHNTTAFVASLAA